MTPAFPSSTFPNHWTLVTGLYPESHGIVGNTVYDPVYDVKMKLAKSNEVQWWNDTEPVWLTAKRQGRKTASSFWVWIKFDVLNLKNMINYFLKKFKGWQ
jgi:predicted AlkP superfamily pyrophosphatase or phosphodiesterase